MNSMSTVATPLLWIAFVVFLVVALAVDLFVMNRKGAHRVGMKEAALWSLVWVALALLFNLGLWWWLHSQGDAAQAADVALEFLTGYVIEKALAVDNIFVFLMLFNRFGVPAEQQQRVLVYGVLMAIVLRAIMIFIGAALIARFHWILYVFGVFLLVTGLRMLRQEEHSPDPSKSRLMVWLQERLPLTGYYHGGALRVLENGKWLYTPLFVVIVLVGITDLIFAVDSIPAIFAITLDPFVVLTSNVFAVLGLRALYFLLAGMADRFHLLNYGLALVLVFIGSKMLLLEVYKIPIGIALGAVALLIGGAIALSLVYPRRTEDPEERATRKPPAA
jgi:tellurite resistance protein TerC